MRRAALAVGLLAIALLALGATLGSSIGGVLARNAWIYLAVFGVAIVALAFTLVRGWSGWGGRRAVQP